MPTLLYSLLWWRNNQASFTYTELLCIYGYSLAIYVPISVRGSFFLWLLRSWTLTVHGFCRKCRWILFLSLAVLDPWVGHTIDVLSPFIFVLYHSDWLFHAKSCPRLDVVHPGHVWSSLPACTWHCSLRYLFLQATPLFPHGVTIVCSRARCPKKVRRQDLMMDESGGWLVVRWMSAFYGMWTIKLCSNKILLLLTMGASQHGLRLRFSHCCWNVGDEIPPSLMTTGDCLLLSMLLPCQQIGYIAAKCCWSVQMDCGFAV